MARSAMMAGSFDRGFEMIWKAIDIEPNYENAYVLLGYQQLTINKLDKAKEYLKKEKI